MTTNFFSPLSFVAVFGSGIRDPGSGMGKNQDPGSGINIPDPQHCKNYHNKPAENYNNCQDTYRTLSTGILIVHYSIGTYKPNCRHRG